MCGKWLTLVLSYQEMCEGVICVSEMRQQLIIQLGRQASSRIFRLTNEPFQQHTDMFQFDKDSV